jgi:two-component system, cell cycle sensor histidine kinase and response regulator CckA
MKAGRRPQARDEALLLFVERSPSAMAMFDREMRYLAVSRRYLSDFRLGERDLLGRIHYEVFPEIPERWKEIHRRCLAGAVERCEEDPFVRADGKVDWVRWEVRPWFLTGTEEVGGLVFFSEDITARKEAELRLETERERLAVTLQSIGDAVIATDEAGRVTLLNPVAERLTGWPAAEAVGRPLDQVFRAVSEETHQPVESPADRVLRAGGVVGLDPHTSLLPRDGTARPIADSGAPIRDRQGRISGVVLVFRDRSAARREELARAESAAALHRSEQRYRLLADHTHDVIWTLDLATRRFTYVSPSILALRGLTVEEALAEPVEQSLTPESLARVAATMGHIGTPEEEDPHTGIYDQPCKDGSIKHVEITTTYLRDAAGRPVEAVGVSRDATARVNAERALVRSEARFRALIERSTDMILVLDAEGRATFWSQGAVEALGWAPEEAAGQPLLDRAHPEDRDRAELVLRRLLARPGESARVTLRHAHRDGGWRELEVTARNLLHDPAVRGVVMNARDATAQRLLEQQFWQAQKLEGIGRLAGGVAHDFNNLLTVILSGVEELRRIGAEGAPATVELADEIGAAGERARDLTRQLLAFARKQVIAPVPLDLGTVVARLEKLLRRLLGEDVALATRLAPGLWPIRCDQGQVEQLLLNLAVNARDAMPGGGTLSIEVSNVEIDPRAAADHPGMEPGPHVRLSVRDSGQGMTPEVRDRIFEPFFTTKETGKGTGLGLATVYGIVQQSEGFIAVDSRPGGGTTFDVWFARAPAGAGEAPELPGREPAGGTETILVVEDEPQVRAVTVRTLRAAGYQVLVAGEGLEALAVAAGARGRIQLLLTDVVMPGPNGRAVAEAVSRVQPGLRVLYVSGYTGDAIAQRGVLEAGVALLEKPFTPKALLARVRAVLDAPAPG